MKLGGKTGKKTP